MPSLRLARQGASAFNQPLSFDTSSVRDMRYMFLVRALRAFRVHSLSIHAPCFAVTRAARTHPAGPNTSLHPSRESPHFGPQDAHAFHQPLVFDTSSVTAILSMFGILSRNTVCTVNGVKTFVHQGDCPPPEAFKTLLQGVDNLDQSLVLNQSVQVVVLVSGGISFEVEEPLEVPAGRNLTIVGNSSENSDTLVRVNVPEELKVDGTIQLERLEVSRADGGRRRLSDSSTDVPLPLVEVLDGGTAELIQTKLRVNVGETAIAIINNGSLVLRDVIIAGERPVMAVALMLVTSADVGEFSLADRAGLAQAIASLAAAPPAAVSLTLEAASLELTFHICISGSAVATATEARLNTLLPNASEASAKLGLTVETAPNIGIKNGDSRCLLGGIALQPQALAVSSGSARRRLADASVNCVHCARWPVTDRPSCFMKRSGISTCADYTFGIGAYCAGSGHRDDGHWFDTAHCQQTCSIINENCCRPHPPPTPHASPCVPCDDEPPRRSIQRAGGRTCGDWTSVRGVELLLDKSCSKERWINDKFCQQSCSDAGCGYTNCCPVPGSSLSSPAPPPPSSPVAPPSIVEAEFADASNVRIVEAANGYAVISLRNTTCIVDGIKTVVQGACIPSGRRLASVSTLAPPAPPAFAPAPAVTYMLLNASAGETLNLSAIPENVTEVRLLGGGEKPIETVGESWLLPAGQHLDLTAIGGDAGDVTRVKINVTGELAKVSGTLRLSGLDIFREPFDDGCGGCEVGFPPLLDILEGGTVEIVGSELRVPLGELVVAVQGSRILTPTLTNQTLSLTFP